MAQILAIPESGVCRNVKRNPLIIHKNNFSDLFYQSSLHLFTNEAGQHQS